MRSGLCLLVASTLAGCVVGAGNAPSAANPATKNTAASQATIKAWKLDQRSRILGDETILVCPAGIKATNRKDGLTMMFAPPFTEVITFSNKTRKVCHQPFDKSENPYAKAVAMFSGIAHGQVPMKKVRDYVRGGLTWTDFSIPEPYGAARKEMYKKGQVTGSEPASGRVTGFHLPMEKRAVDWMARLYCVPKTGTVPFDVTFQDVDDGIHSLVKTFSMVSTQLPATEFKCPSGLHEVKDPRAVTQDESSADAFEMMMGK